MLPRRLTQPKTNRGSHQKHHPDAMRRSDSGQDQSRLRFRYCRGNLRMVSRLPQFGGTLGWDDAVMTFVVVLVAPLTCLSVVCKYLDDGRITRQKLTLNSGKPWSG